MKFKCCLLPNTKVIVSLTLCLWSVSQHKGTLKTRHCVCTWKMGGEKEGSAALGCPFPGGWWRRQPSFPLMCTCMAYFLCVLSLGMALEDVLRRVWSKGRRLLLAWESSGIEMMVGHAK